MTSFDRELNRPEYREGNWHIPLNENWDDLNTRDIALGSLDDRPVPNEDFIPDGGLYIVNDPGDADYGAVYRYHHLNEEWSLADRRYGDIVVDSLTVNGESNLFSGDYNDLSNIPSTFSPETHGDSAHSENYAVSDRVETISSDWNFSGEVSTTDIDIDRNFVFDANTYQETTDIQDVGVHWEIVDHFDISDSSAQPFDETIDVSSYSRNDELKVKLHTGTEVGDGYYHLTLNGVDTGYEFNSRAGNTLNQYLGESTFQLVETSNSRHQVGEWTISNPPVGGGRAYIYGNGITRAISREALVSGSLNSGILSLDEIRLFCDEDVIGGWIEVQARRV